MTRITRHFMTVGSRRVHYRRAGEGPPLVLLHGSPANSEVMEGEIAALAHQFTCFALDTPGFGGSDALDGEVLTVAELADATAQAIEALDLSGTRLLGTHTGAAIGLELAVRRPDLLGGIVLDGVPAFTREEADALFAGYFAPLETDPLGGHLTTTWMRFRDQFTWFPWLSRNHERLNPIDRPGPTDIDLWVRMFYRSCWKYKPAYRAACFYCEDALKAAAALTLPAIFMATEDDMLFPHLARLPLLKAGQSIRKVKGDYAEKLAALVDSVSQLPGLATAPAKTGPNFGGNDPDLTFIETPGGEIFVRRFGSPANASILLLHDAPGSGYGLETLARQLADRFHVLLPDLPGCGESGIGDGDAVEAAAAAMESIADLLHLRSVTLFGRGTGSIVASAILERGHMAVTRTICDGVPLPDPAISANIAPDLPIDPTGSHWLSAWLMVRDGETSAPWFDGSVSAQRPVQGDYGAHSLHLRTFEIMKARSTYFRLPRAAYLHDPIPGLRAAGGRIVLLDRVGSPHPMMAQLGDLLPDITVIPVEREDELLSAMAPFLPSSEKEIQ